MTDHDDLLSELGMAPSAENSGTSTATFGNNSPDPTTLAAAALPTTEAPSSPDKSDDIELYSSGNEWQQVAEVRRPDFLPPIGTDSSNKSWVPVVPEFPTYKNEVVSTLVFD